MHTQQGLKICECAERCVIEQEDVKRICFFFVSFFSIFYRLKCDILLKHSLSVDFLSLYFKEK